MKVERVPDRVVRSCFAGTCFPARRSTCLIPAGRAQCRRTLAPQGSGDVSSKSVEFNEDQARRNIANILNNVLPEEFAAADSMANDDDEEARSGADLPEYEQDLPERGQREEVAAQFNSLRELDARMSGSFGFELVLTDALEQNALESRGMDPGYMLQLLGDLSPDERAEEERMVKLEAETFLNEITSVGLTPQEKEKIVAQGSEIASMVAVIVEEYIELEIPEKTIEWLDLALKLEEHLHGYVSENKADWFEKVGIFASEMQNEDLAIGSFQRAIDILETLGSDLAVSTASAKSNYALALVSFDRLDNARMLLRNLIEAITPVIELYNEEGASDRSRGAEICVAVVALWNVIRICSRSDIGLAPLTPGPLAAIERFSELVCGAKSEEHGQDLVRFGCLLIVADHMTERGERWIEQGMTIVENATGKDSDKYKHLEAVKSTVLQIAGPTEKSKQT